MSVKQILDQDKRQYEKIVKNHLIENNDDFLIEKFGRVKLKGKEIDDSNSVILYEKLLSEINRGVIMENCMDKKSNKICETKIHFKNWLSQKHIFVFNFNQTIEQLFQNNHISEDEYHFMIVCGYFLNSFSSSTK